MQRRRFFRKKVNLAAKLSSNCRNCNVSINNLSKEGVSLITLPFNHGDIFSKGNIYQLKFKTFSGYAVDLQCQVKWSCRTPPLGLTNSIGLKIVNPPSAYNKFIKTL